MKRQLRDVGSLSLIKRVGIFAAIAALLAQPLAMLPSDGAFAAPITTQVVINEINPFTDQVELYNGTSSAVTLNGWTLTEHVPATGAASTVVTLNGINNIGGDKLKLLQADTSEDSVVIGTVTGQVPDVALPATNQTAQRNGNADTTKPIATVLSPVDGGFNPTEYKIAAHDEDKLAVVTGNLYKGATLIKSCTAGSLAVADYELICPVAANLTEGTYTIRYNALDASGNLSTTATSSFIVDRTKPGLYVKTNSVGNISQLILREADFKLTDNYKVAAYHINGVRKPISPNAYSDANDIKVGANGGVYGLNTIQTEDLAGNMSDVFNFTLDNKLPTIDVKSESIGTNDRYKTVSFKLFDTYKIDKVTINGVEKNLTDSQWSDLNGIKPGVYGAIAGPNTLNVYDVAGNVKEYIFTIDVIAPSGSFTYSPSNNVIKKGPVTITLTTTEPIRTPNDWTKVSDTVFTKEVANNVNSTLKITDIAGNESGNLQYEVKRIDNTEPVIQGVTDGDLRKEPLVNFTVVDQNFSHVVIDGTQDNCTYSGADYIWNCPGVSSEGAHTIVAVDKAGNETRVGFVIDTKLEAAVTYSPNNGGPTNQNVIVTVAADEAITLSDNAHSDWVNSTDGKIWTRTFTEDVTGVVVVRDLAGNSATLNYQVTGIDKDAPVVAIVGDPQRNTDGTYLIQGTTSESSGIVTVIANETSYQAPVALNGTWSVMVSLIESLNGTLNVITAEIEDEAGNLSVTDPLEYVASIPFTRGSPVGEVEPLTTPAEEVTPVARTTYVPQVNIGTIDDDSGSILGTNTTNDDAATTTVAAIAPSEEGWKIFGMAWYWWLLILAALAAAGWAGRNWLRNRAES